MTKATHVRIREVADELQSLMDELRRGSAVKVLSAEVATVQQTLLVLERLARRSKMKKPVVKE